MRVYLYHAIGMFLCAALQTAWPTWLMLGGQRPDLVLVLTLAAGLARGPQEGLVAGFLGALFLGSAQTLPLAPLFAELMVVGFVSGLLRGRLVSDRSIVAILLTFVAATVIAVITLILAPPAAPGMWLKATLWLAIYSAALAAPLFAAVNVLNAQYPLRIDQ